MVLIWYRIAGKHGLTGWLVLSAIIANQEVTARISAFGYTQTLGNMLFASTFLTTEILSEFYGRNAANRAVKISILSCLSYILLTQFWLYFQPSANDTALSHLFWLADTAPRVMLSGFLTYALVQKLNVFLYHKIWSLSAANSRHLLWLRNNGATIISQLVNSVLFNTFSFYGVFPDNVLLEVILTSFTIFFCTSILDTPFIYIIRYLKAPDTSENFPGNK